MFPRDHVNRPGGKGRREGGCRWTAAKPNRKGNSCGEDICIRRTKVELEHARFLPWRRLANKFNILCRSASVELRNDKSYLLPPFPSLSHSISFPLAPDMSLPLLSVLILGQVGNCFSFSAPEFATFVKFERVTYTKMCAETFRT